MFALLSGRVLESLTEAMVLSGRTIKEEIARGRTVIEPLDPNCIQPASVDIHLDKELLGFETCRHPFYTDVKQGMDDVTELVEIDGEISFLRLTSLAERTYGSPGLQSKYQGQSGPTASKYSNDYQEG